MSLSTILGCQQGKKQAEREDAVQTEEVDESEPQRWEEENGLIVELKERGAGQLPEVGDIVFVNYIGRLRSNNTVFDSSAVGQPFRFPIGKGRVIKGWDQGIMKLREGAKAQLIIPAHLGYGDKDRGNIPANSDLVFDVEVVRIKRAPKPTEHQPFDASGVDTMETNSGLRYCIIEPGEGDLLKAGDKALVHYYGQFASNGQRFDDSYSRGEPLPAVLGEGSVIAGWEEALALMRVGGKYKVFIPSYLAYGDRGFPGVIPTNSDLIFDMQVVAKR